MKAGKTKSAPAAASVSATEPPLTELLLSRVEFHRDALAVLPEPGEKTGHVVFYHLKTTPEGPVPALECSCRPAKGRICTHLPAARELLLHLPTPLPENIHYEQFLKSPWHALAQTLGAAGTPALAAVRVHLNGPDEPPGFRIALYRGADLIHYMRAATDNAKRLRDRLLVTSGDERLTRADVLSRLTFLAATPSERIFNARDFKSQKQIIENGFWYRFAYHCFREFGFTGLKFTQEPLPKQKRVRFSALAADGKPVFTFTVPEAEAAKLMNVLVDSLPAVPQAQAQEAWATPVLRVRFTARGSKLELMPLLKVTTPDGHEHVAECANLARPRFGDKVYVPGFGAAILRLPPGRVDLPVYQRQLLTGDKVPAFLLQHRALLQEPGHDVEPAVAALAVQTTPPRLTAQAHALDRDWCWLSLEYDAVAGTGEPVPLLEALAQRQLGRRYCRTASGWLDTEAPEVSAVLDLVAAATPQDNGQLRLSRAELLRLAALAGAPLGVRGDAAVTVPLERILEFKPVAELPPLRGLKSVLRHYQEAGLRWLKFLVDNGLGGLLCDDMGLGKTHQIMALMVALREEQPDSAPCLVVCPTSVLSHWQEKLARFAPGLKVALFYGERDLDKALANADVLLTSYGIMRIDAELLQKRHFSLLVFDEIQNLKNTGTVGYKAACTLDAAVKLGLSGTPIENRLSELKALFDMVLPGYLGAARDFDQTFVQPIELSNDAEARTRLHRIVAPFTLRRLKESVLTELPEKIEDTRFCTLSPQQVELYRQAIASQGADIAQTLSRGQAPVPYMHVFALLNLLKQICNHPAQAASKPEDYQTYQSGKWESFTEVLDECLESDQKVVVFTQYLDMIAIMEKYLTAQGVGYVTLTGQSRERGKILSKFNDDPKCRVFIGSLKAGGTGIDLIAASVVIHYDRWWNAAREEQATDRVHRMGQTRGVQVFKFVTRGTLEEKINAIIERKRALLDSVVQEDSADTLKAFSRDELLDLLRPPT